MIILLTIAFAVVNLSQCCQPAISWKPDGDIQGVTSGSTYIVRQPQEYQSIYDAPLRQFAEGTNYEVVAGLSLIEKYSDSSALEYTIRVVKKPGLFSIFFTASQTAKWTAIIIHYIVSIRSDVIVGDFSVQKEYLQFQAKKERSRYAFQYRYLENKAEGKNVDAEAFVFLTGIKSSNKLVVIQIEQSFVNEDNLQITTSISNIVQKIELIRFGYIIYERKIQNFKLSTIFEIQPRQAAIIKSKESKNQFLAITGINVGSTNNIRDAARSQGEQFGKFRVQGISLEVGEGSIYGFSDDGEKLVKNEACQKLELCLKEGGSLEIYEDDQLSCIKCKNNSVYDSRLQKCANQKSR